MKYFASALLLTAGLAAAATAYELKTIEPSDIADIRRVSDPQVSPNGKSILYVVDIPVKPGEHRNAHIWLVPVDGQQPAHTFTLSAGADTSPRWSPDGKVVAFLSDRVDPLADSKGTESRKRLTGTGGRDDLGEWAYTEEKHKRDTQIWLIPVNGGEARPLTDIPGGVRSFKWSRDGAFLAFSRGDGDTKEERDRKARKSDHILIDRNYHFDRLWVYTLSDRTTRLVTKKDINIDDYDLSPNGKSFIVRVSDTPRLNDYWYLSRILIIDSTSGETTKVLSDRGSSKAVRWSRLGNKVLFGEKTTREIADTTLLLDLDSGQKVEVGPKLKATLHGLDWNPDGNTLLTEGVEGTHKFFARIDGASGAVSHLPEMGSNAGNFTQSDDGTVVAYLGDSTSHPNEVNVYSKSAGTKCLTETNPQVSEWKLGKVQEISWTNSKDGQKVYGVLVLPPDYQPGTPHKTVVHAHGGPFEAWQTGWLGGWYQWEQLLASHGYVVLAPNPRGSQGQGVAFQEANFQDWGGGDFQDVMDGVDFLIKEKIADPSRLGIGGWSYGGFMTSWTITHTDRFKAAVVGAAVTDLYGMSTTTDIAPSYLTEFFGNFVTNRKMYDEHSPMRYIERCHTPALVLHGDADERVPTFQGEEFYKALRMLDREAQLVRYPREPHIFTEREHQIDSMQRIIDWYDSHLGK